jgi:hypothetical protein
MARKKRKPRTPKPKPQQPSEEKSLNELEKECEKVDDKILEKAEQFNEDLLDKADSVAEADLPDPGKSPKDWLNKVKDGLRKIAVLEGHLKRETNNLKTKQEKSDKLAEEQQEWADQFEEKSKLLESREQDIEEREKELLPREEKISEREADADNEFRKRNKRNLELLDEEREGFRQKFSEACQSFAQDNAESDVEVAKLRKELLKKEESLTKKEEAFAKKQRANKLEAELLMEDRKAIKSQVEKLSAAKVTVLEVELSASSTRLETYQSILAQKEGKIAEYEKANLAFGQKSPSEVLEEIEVLKKTLDESQTALGERPKEETVEHVKILERQNESWRGDRLRLMSENANLKERLERNQIAATELRTLEDRKESLVVQVDMLEKALHEELREVKNELQGIADQSKFPSCSQMDADVDFDRAGETSSIRSLKQFVHFAQHAMAAGVGTDGSKKLYYSERTLRSFIGGLAMTKLHLLQGISGTGKTSLPQAFAEVIGAGESLIEVQAGWRDKQDLIGHYNSFEKKFYENECLKALYKAGLPRYANLPFFIILDEMNLSHPEQYFADFLSAIEQDRSRQRISLMTEPISPVPNLMVEEGRYLPIPPNVWFVGTANQDETTKDFAAKTHDRAHVMNMPRNPAEFDCEPGTLRNPVGFEALENAFGKAREKHANDAEKSYKYLDDQFGGILGSRFEIGWGNRLEAQMKSYVPVVMACGGTLGEATDHILASKLLRTIPKRHDNRPEDLNSLREKIELSWEKLGDKSKPSDSLQLIKEELSRLGEQVD